MQSIKTSQKPHSCKWFYKRSCTINLAVITAIISWASLSSNILLAQHVQQLRIGYWSSWEIRCGIAVYTEHLVRALERNGHKVIVYPHNTAPEKLIAQAKQDHIKIVNIQYEPVTMPAKHILIDTIVQLKKAGIKVFITVHRECEDLYGIVPLVDQVIFHKDSAYFKKNPKVCIIPMATPVYQPVADRKKLRKKYGFSQDAIIISTFGFLAGWKEYPAILELLVPWLKSNPKHHLQILASFNDFGLQGCFVEDNKIKEVIKRYRLEKKVTYITDFLSQDVISERLALSNLGYLWAPMDTQGSSAASKEFVAARLPFVASNSSHYHDINVGVIKTPKEKEAFIKTINSLINKRNMLTVLQKKIEAKYQQTNYNKIIEQHTRLFRKA